MSSAAHQFGLVEFWISNICCCFLQAGTVEKSKQIFKIRHVQILMSCLGHYSGSFVQRQKRITIYHVKKFVKDSQLWQQTLSILPDFLENWHFISHFVWKSTKTLELLRIFDELFDVINGEPFLTLYKTSAYNLTFFKIRQQWNAF